MTKKYKEILRRFELETEPAHRLIANETRDIIETEYLSEGPAVMRGFKDYELSDGTHLLRIDDKTFLAPDDTILRVPEGNFED